MIFLKKKHVIPKQGGGGGGSPIWEKFPHFPVFFGRERPLTIMCLFSEMFFLPFMVAMAMIFYSLAAVNYYFDSNYTTDM